jgi:acyl-coenzyme A synthetase/AMP-(fatty) acid ligase
MRKIRGFRVELGEIEACLLKNPATAEVAAEVDDHDDAHATLVAFVVPAKGAPRDGLALKRHCAQFLPPYMVPRIVWRDSMPVTATGKVDRRALVSELVERPREQAGV